MVDNIHTLHPFTRGEVSPLMGRSEGMDLSRWGERFLSFQPHPDGNVKERRGGSIGLRETGKVLNFPTIVIDRD